MAAGIILTASHLKLPHVRKRLDISDLNSPLHLLLQPEPSTLKTWVCRPLIKGELRTIKIGNATGKDAISLKDARKRAAEIYEAVEAGEDPAEEQVEKNAQVRSGSLLIEAIAEDWLADLPRRLKAKTIGNYTSIYTTYVKPKLGHVRIDLLKRPMVQAIINDLWKRGNDATARQVGKVMRSLFEYAMAEGLVDGETDPTLRLKKPADAERDRVFLDKELELVWAATERLDDVRRRVFVRLNLLLGNRRGELEQLTRAQLDVEKGEWDIPKEATKGNSQGRLLPLAPLCWDILAELPAVDGAKPTERLFTSYTVATAGKRALDMAILEELCARHGVAVEPISEKRSAAVQALERFDFKPFVIHDLRRSAGTGLARIKTFPVIIEAVLGHESGAAKGGKVAGIYNRHDYLEEKAEALGKWAEHISRLAGSNVMPLRRAA